MESNLVWCRSGRVILEDYRRQALKLNNNEGKVVAATKKLVEGLAKALSTTNGSLPAQSLSRTAIARGIKLAEAIGFQDLNNSSENKDNIFSVLNNYYGFILTQVSKLDEDFFIPHFSCHQDCSDWDPKKFEERFVDYSRAQLKFPLETLTSWDAYAGVGKSAQKEMGVTGQYFVKGNTYIFTQAMAVALHGARIDLTAENSLYSEMFACVRGDMLQLEIDLSRFNQCVDYSDARYMENEFISRAQKIVKDLHPKMCVL